MVVKYDRNLGVWGNVEGFRRIVVVRGVTVRVDEHSKVEGAMVVLMVK